MYRITLSQHAGTQVSLDNEQKQLWWDTRHRLDTALQQCVENIEVRLFPIIYS